VPKRRKLVFQGMPEDVMPLLENFVRVTERKRQLAEGREEESNEEEEEENQSEPDHDFWAHDADWQGYRTRVNTVVQGYQGPEGEEFSFYKKEKDPSDEQQTETGNNEARGSEWRDKDWYENDWYDNNWYNSDWYKNSGYSNGWYKSSSSKDNDKWY